MLIAASSLSSGPIPSSLLEQFQAAYRSIPSSLLKQFQAAYWSHSKQPIGAIPSSLLEQFQAAYWSKDRNEPYVLT
jgi:hypothetical protein